MQPAFSCKQKAPAISRDSLNLQASKGTRTLDPRITNALLYQLSHRSMYNVLY